MIDSHAHLQFEQFDGDRDQLIEELRQRMDKIVLPGVNPEDNRKARKLAEKHGFLEYCAGAHPLYDSDIERVREQVSTHEPAAIGEIGLDHHYITDQKKREASKEVFREMLELAESTGLGAVIHSRNAEAEAIEISESFDVECFFHCFNGRPELAERIVENGDFIGVTGQVLDSSRVQELADVVPMDSILLETDSPFLGPEKRNTPLTVFRVAEKLAEIKGIPVEEVGDEASGNAREFFRFQS